MYYNNLKARMKFKSTGFKITMIYIMIFFLAPDMFKDILSKQDYYLEIYGEIFKCVLILLCYFSRFENIFLKLNKIER